MGCRWLGRREGRSPDRRASQRSVAGPPGDTGGRELRRGLVAQRRVRPMVVVIQPMVLADHLRFLHAREQLPVQQLVAEAAAEGLGVAVLVSSGCLFVGEATLPCPGCTRGMAAGIGAR